MITLFATRVETANQGKRGNWELGTRGPGGSTRKKYRKGFQNRKYPKSDDSMSTTL